MATKPISQLFRSDKIKHTYFLNAKEKYCYYCILKLKPSKTEIGGRKQMVV